MEIKNLMMYVNPQLGQIHMYLSLHGLSQHFKIFLLLFVLYFLKSVPSFSNQN